MQCITEEQNVKLIVCYKGGWRFGFRELSKFNIAMPAKQGWRLLNGDNPLVTNMMKARYFPNSDYLNASLGVSPSYMWRSIIVAHDVVKQWYRRRTGNGASTDVWKVPWLPCTKNGMLTSVIPLAGTY